MTEPIKVTPEQVLDYVGSDQPITVVLPMFRYRLLELLTATEKPPEGG